MSYSRVIPRDLFNEGDLLKCYGRLWCLLDETGGHKAALGNENNERYGAAFNIVQNDNDGSLMIHNVPFFIAGQQWNLSRPLNCRNPWPLWVTSPDEEIQERVFTEEGSLSLEFKKLIMGL